MRTTILIIVAAIAAFAANAQHYTLHKATKGVTVESAGKSTAATEGMTLKATDNLVIPTNGYAEVMNNLDKRIYKSIRTGRVSVMKLMIEARQSATDNLATVGSKLKLGRGGAQSGKRVYVEKGMVNRSLAVFDPEGEKREMDTESLARYIAAALRSSQNDTIPEGLVLTSCADNDKEASVSLTNNLGYPIYFNILKYAPGSDIEISTLGQPGGSYVLMSGQSIARSQSAPLAAGAKTVVFAAPCQFDLNTVIDEVNRNLADPSFTAAKDESLPVFVRTL